MEGSTGSEMFWFVYNLLFAVGFAFLIPRFLYRMWRRGGYVPGFAQRFAILDAAQIATIRERQRIWIHAVSVGEVLVALRFIEVFRSEEPGAAFVLTTVTSTGHSVAKKRMHPRDVLLYFPLDFTTIIKRELELIKPRAVILVEGELWPNLIRLAKQRAIPVVLINGRLSARSSRGYRMVGSFFKRGINLIDLICLQSKYDEERLLALGADPHRVKVMGTGKYDVAEHGVDVGDKAWALLEAVGIGRSNQILVGGSTWSGEERILLHAFTKLRSLFPELRLVLVPRHFERAVSVAAEIERAGLNYSRRSSMDETGQGDSAPQCDVLLVDTTGELMSFYACATVIFVGKSMTSHGGQNIIEPAMFGAPIVTGTHMENFPGVVDDFTESNALLQVSSEQELEETLSRLLADEELRKTYGSRAADVVFRKKGTLPKTVQLVRTTVLSADAAK